MVMANDGTKSYDHHRDGITQQLGGCLRDFRNKPFPIRIKLEYYKRVLTVYYHSGLNNDLSSYEICARVENLDLPKSGHFGVSAETGGLADDQDVVSFITHSLLDKPAVQDTNTFTNEEQKKYDKEYEEFLKQMEMEKEKYAKEHPEKASEILDEKKYVGSLFIFILLSH
jgi:mannose-binding lectin 1